MWVRCESGIVLSPVLFNNLFLCLICKYVICNIILVTKKLALNKMLSKWMCVFVGDHSQGAASGAEWGSRRSLPVLLVFTKVTVKQSRFRPAVAQRVPGSKGSQITWQRHRMVVRLSALRTGRLYPKEMLPVLISVRGRVDPRAIVRSEWLCQWKIPMTPSGIELEAFRFVAQRINHCATAVVLSRLATV